MIRSTAAVRLLAGDKEPVRLASTGNLSLSGLLTVDSVVSVAGDRILVKDQTDATENGIYTASEGAWYRAPDASATRVLIAGMKVAVQEGTTQAGDVWNLDTDRPDLGDDDVEWSLYLNTAIADDINNAREALVDEMDAIIATALAAGKATQSEAEAGVSNVGWMTPLRTRQAIKKVGVQFYGAVGDGVTDNTTAFASAKAALAAVGGGILEIPAGFYLLPSGFTADGNIIVRGAGRVSTWLIRRTDGMVLTLSATGQNSAEHLAIMGYGAGPMEAFLGETTFNGSSLTGDALVMSSSGAFLRDIQVQGGRHALYIDCIDSILTNVDCSFSYGSSNVYTIGANWHYRCKWDTGGEVGATVNPPYPAWAAATAYTVGNIVSRSGFLLICSTAGTSAASAPTLRNYGLTISDGAVLRWKLLAPATYYGLYVGGGSVGENHFNQVDLSGSGGYAASLVVDQTPTGAGVVAFDSGVISDIVVIEDADWVSLTNNVLGSSVILSVGLSGYTTIANNWSVTTAAFNVVVGANVGKFSIIGNHMRGGSITVAVGTSNRYQIAHNNEVTVTDGGTGVDKSVSGNS